MFELKVGKGIGLYFFVENLVGFYDYKGLNWDNNNENENGEKSVKFVKSKIIVWWLIFCVDLIGSLGVKING